ncbi:Amino-acid acetyltransferase, mitochondrial [Borealophlyctis nickersoniae]|nr:Amino-acid acetyltransferase, mitochondrial [Borealophlyctis nickersoniae]
MPSQREARHFLKRFNQVPANLPNGVHLRDLIRNAAPVHASKADEILIHSQRQEHLGLIKLEGGLPSDQLKAFAETLVQLQKLGLTPLVVLDSDGINSVRERRVVEPFSTARAPRRRVDTMGLNNEDKAMRDAIMSELFRVAEAIDEAGGRAMALYGGVFKRNEYGLSEPGDNLTSATNSVSVELKPLQAALAMHQIPVLAPMGTVEPASLNCILPARHALVALSRTLLAESTVGLPVKMVIVNGRGGVSVRGQPLGFVNLEDEFNQVRSGIEDSATVVSPPSENGSQEPFQHERLAISQLNDLETAQTVLSILPSSSSAVIASAASSAALISNLITDKPLSSASIPQPYPKTHHNSAAPVIPPTVLRRGLKVDFHSSLVTLDQPALTKLLESSFKKKLDDSGFWTRIQQVLDGVIVAGAYDGAAIVTIEKDPTVNGGDGIPYLDKFSVAPTSQGIGVADILWKQLKKRYPDLVWRSRADNPVNKW